MGRKTSISLDPSSSLPPGMVVEGDASLSYFTFFIALVMEAVTR